MARSKPRKKKVEKVRQERTVQHMENRTRKEDVGLFYEVVKGILTNHPPVKKEEPITLEEIERWFDSDPEAPVVLYSLPPDEHSWESRRIQITVNQLAVERHLRARGMDENHPSLELGCEIVGKTLRDAAKELLEDYFLERLDDDFLEDPPWDEIPDPRSGWISSAEPERSTSDER